MRRPLRREFIYQMVETARLLRNHVDQRAREHGTTRAQWGVLARLRRQEGLNQAALAEQMELQPISLARLLDRLQSQGLIERRAHPSDRRAYRLYLTASGRSLVNDLDSVRSQIADEMLGDVPDSTLILALDLMAGIREATRARRDDDKTQAPADAGHAA